METATTHFTRYRSNRNLGCQMLVYIISCYLLLSFAEFQISAMESKKVQVEFEVFGRVQGVFFRKYTQQKSKELGLKGWCRNTNDGTVKGVIEGDQDKVKEMKQWLQRIGSPSSKITKAQFNNEKEILLTSFENFSIKR